MKLTNKDIVQICIWVMVVTVISVTVLWTKRMSPLWFLIIPLIESIASKARDGER